MDALASPTVTIVTPAYNAEATLAETIDSVLGQTRSDFEMIVIDDGSSDSTAAIAARYAAADQRVRLVSQANRGISTARNTALRQARGAFVALLDSDDTWMPDYLARQLAIFEGTPDADVLTVNAFNRGGSLDQQPMWPVSDTVRGLDMLEMIEREDAVCIMSMFRRRVFETIGGFNEQLRSNEDYDYWMRAAGAGFRFMVSFRPAAFYRRRADSVSADERRMLNGISVVLRAARKTLPSDSAEARGIDRQLARYHRELMVVEAREAIKSGDARRGIGYLQQVPVENRSLPLTLAVRLGTLWPDALRYAYWLRSELRRVMVGNTARRVNSTT